MSIIWGHMSSDQIMPLIVGVNVGLEHIPYILIASSIAIIIHEGIHGIIAKRKGIPANYIGFSPILGGFVRIGNKTLKRPVQEIRVAAAGPFINLVAES